MPGAIRFMFRIKFVASGLVHSHQLGCIRKKGAMNRGAIPHIDVLYVCDETLDKWTPHLKGAGRGRSLCGRACIALWARESLLK